MRSHDYYSNSMFHQKVRHEPSLWIHSRKNISQRLLDYQYPLKSPCSLQEKVLLFEPAGPLQTSGGYKMDDTTSTRIYHIDFFLIWTISLTESFACLWCDGRAVVPEILPSSPPNLWNSNIVEGKQATIKLGERENQGLCHSRSMVMESSDMIFKFHIDWGADIEPMPRGWKWNQSSK